MKLYKFFAIAAAALLGLGAVSCNNNENEDISKPECKFNAETLEFDANGNLVSPDIDAVTLLATRDWTISCDSAFVGIDPLSGKASSNPQTIEITVTKNNGYDRSAIIKANAGKGLAKATLNIKQAGALGDENEHLLITVAEFISKADGTNPYVLEGKIYALGAKQFYLNDGTGTIQVYQPNNIADFDLEPGGNAKVKGVYKLFTDKSGVQTHEIDNCSIVEYTGPDTNNMVFHEFFVKSLGNFTEEVKSGTLTSVWAYDASYKCAKATAFASQKANASESWLISPEIDLTGETAATLTFDHACNYFTAVSREVSVYVSRNGGDYVQIKVPAWPTSFTFVSSEAISLKDFLGSKIRVAFAYTSTASSAGTYELQNFVISKTDSGETPYPTLAECSSVADILALANDDAFSLTSPVLVVAKTTGGVVVNDATGAAYVYGEGVANAVIGDKITFKAVRSEYNGVPEITAPDEVTVASSGNAVTYPEATDITANFDAFTATTPVFISMTGLLSTSKNAAGDQTYYNIEVPGATMQGSVSLPLESFGLDALVGKQIKVTGYYNGISGKTTKYQNVIATEVEESDAPYLTVDNTAVSVAADATSATITVGGNATWTATSEDAGVTIDPASGTGEGTVTVTFAANTDEENAKTYTVKIATEQEAPVKSYDVVITQKKAGSAAGGSATYTLTFSAETNQTKVGNYTSTWEAKCDDFTWVLTNFNNNNTGPSGSGSWTYVRCGRKSDPSVASIATKTVIPEAIEIVIITFSAYSSTPVISAKLYIDTAEDYSSASCQTVSINGAEGEVSVNVPSPAQNCYYKIEFDCKADGSKNGPIQIDKVVYTNE